MKFRTAYCSKEEFPSPSGSRFKKLYRKILNPDGRSELVDVGVEDVHDTIQKAACGNVIEDLIRRAKSGDDTAIGVPVDSYADLTNMPTDLLSAHAMMLEARDKYYSLPVQIRAKYGNSFDAFISAVGDGSLQRDIESHSSPDPGVTPLSREEIAQIRKSLTGGAANA